MRACWQENNRPDRIARCAKIVLLAAYKYLIIDTTRRWRWHNAQRFAISSLYRTASWACSALCSIFRLNQLRVCVCDYAFATDYALTEDASIGRVWQHFK